MRKLVSILFAVGLCFAGAAFAQSWTPVVFHAGATGNADGTELEVSHYSTVGVQISGSFTAAVNFEARPRDSETWSTLRCTNTNDGEQATLVAAASTWQCPTAGFYKFRARVSGYSSGIVIVIGHGTTAVSKSGGGGGVISWPTNIATAATTSESTPLKVRGTGGQSTSGLNIYQHSNGTPTIKCVIAGVEGDCDVVVSLNANKKYQIKNSVGTLLFEVDSATGEISEGTLNVETAGVTVTTVVPVQLSFASCVGAAASNSFNDSGDAATAPTAACNDTGAIQRPSSDFSGSAVNSVEFTFKLPTDWTGNIDFRLRYVTVAASPTGNVEWDISTVCRAVGESWDAAFNAAQTITDAVGSQNNLNDATQTTLTITGCAAGEDFTTRISRDGVNDTNNDLAKAMHAEWTLRRAQ